MKTNLLRLGLELQLEEDSLRWCQRRYEKMMHSFEINEKDNQGANQLTQVHLENDH